MNNRSTKSFGNFCPQNDQIYINAYKELNMKMSLDCLTINIFTPTNVSNVILLK